MRKAVVWSTVLACLAALVALNGAQAQRTISDTGGSSGSNVVPVVVSNFPTTQEVTGTVVVDNFPRIVEVTGTVNVGNFPATQTVTGNVAVSNLPVDDEGNLRVAGVSTSSPARAPFVGITQGTVPHLDRGDGFLTYSILRANRACHAEFPRTRICDAAEIAFSIPPPPAWEGNVLIAFEVFNLAFGAICLDSGGFSGACEDALPVACCGF